VKRADGYSEKGHEGMKRGTEDCTRRERRERRERERERKREREEEKRRGAKKRERKRDREGSEQAQGIMEYETTSERRNEEGPRRWERDGARGSRFRELLNSRGPGLEAGFVVEPSRCMYMR